MDKDMITLWAEAKRAGIADYRKIQPAELRKLIAKAKTGASAPAKGKPASANGAKGKAAATAVVKGKGKPAAPAKGKATTRKPAAPRGKVAPKATAPKATAAKRTSTRGKAAESYAVRIDNKTVNWKADWNGGSKGKRGIVMESLRKHKGDKDKVFAEVKRYATKWYADKDKHAADRMVRWLVGRVALDFVKATGQHESGVRAAYGTSAKPNDVRRREARASTRPKARRKPAGKPATGRTASAKGKAAPAARKPAGGRTTASRGKSTSTTRSRTAAPAKGKGKNAAKARR